jgi:thioredoxin 1
MELLTTQTFKEKIFNFDESSKFKYKGDKPSIVDYSAAWCGPCKIITPILEELSKEYEGQIYIYKVDVDENPEVANAFGIRNIPAILFIPIEGEPEILVGAMPKKSFVKAIEDILKVK